jgi:threonyl-tRNA synthetase
LTHLLAPSVNGVAEPTFFVVTADDVIPLGEYPDANLNAGLECLVEQEVLGQRNEVVPGRLSELLQNLGFGWEPLSEPGHMRVVGPAAFMLNRAKEHAASVAGTMFADLGIPSIRVAGVSLVDPSAPVMRDYIRLTSGEDGLYGDAPYHVGGADHLYMLRQTSCFQKYSACLDHKLVARSLPAALFEISDSFRREPRETLQLGYRLRRFHLPEAHVHARTVREAAEVALHLHAQILLALSELEAEVVLLISATHKFASSHGDYFQRLASHTGAPALLKVAAPGRMCEDGVEVDVEFKVVDSSGCCRELSTFQVDEQITRTFGVSCDDGTTPATIHAVLTGGVERYLYLTLDRVVRAEAAGERRRLPLWISPVIARVVPADPAAVRCALSVATQLHRAGIRTELDDRAHPIGAAITAADSLLVPYLVLVGTGLAGEDQIVRVRNYESGVFTNRQVADLIYEIKHAIQPVAGEIQRLSRQPFH